MKNLLIGTVTAVLAVGAGNLTTIEPLNTLLTGLLIIAGGVVIAANSYKEEQQNG